MSLHHAAQHLAAQGRHGDDMLVHMNPKEVEGLQALAEQKGTSLTTNPETGLPEAFGLGSLNPVRIVQGKGEIGEALGPAAPILAGLALGPAGFGLMSAGMAGLTVGGITALASGNLAKGLSAGLGAYGGASLGASLSGMGEASLAAQAESANEIAAQTGVGSGASSATPSMLDKLGAGAEYAAKNPTEALKTLGEGSTLKGAGILGAAAAPILAGNMVQTATPPPQSSGLIRPYQFNRQVVTPTDMVQPTYQPMQNTAERNWFQDTLTAQTPYESPGPEYKKMAGGGDVEIDPNMQEVATFDPVVRMAEGGLGSLGGYASGGNPRLLKGPGDGMSDNIPAVIGGKQPARLADGEFVIPADVVSHLGNGSTEAGAKQLYKMMDRIRQKRTGKKKQAPEVNPTRVMPA